MTEGFQCHFTETNIQNRHKKNPTSAILIKDVSSILISIWT